jgi:hypothetical protein
MEHPAKICLLLCFLFIYSLIKAQDVTKQDTSRIIYLEKVNSVDELFGKFKDKIVRLYISLEKPENDSSIQMKNIDNWKRIIKKFNLSGYHYYGLLYSDFMHSVTEKIMKGKLCLPRFSIIDKEGVIVDRDAKRPSNVDALIKALKRYLN